MPQEFAEIASKAVAEATTPIEQVRALQTMLSEGGFFSHGLEGEALSRAGHGAERISTLLGADQMVGDDEQYAVAMALLAGELGIPARVVMGFYPEEDAAGERRLHRHRRLAARVGRAQSSMVFDLTSSRRARDRCSRSSCGMVSAAWMASA